MESGQRSGQDAGCDVTSASFAEKHLQVGEGPVHYLDGVQFIRAGSAAVPWFIHLDIR